MTAKLTDIRRAGIDHRNISKIQCKHKINWQRSHVHLLCIKHSKKSTPVNFEPDWTTVEVIHFKVVQPNRVNGSRLLQRRIHVPVRFLLQADCLRQNGLASCQTRGGLD